MNGKCYYLTTIGTWRTHAERFANSHFIALTGTLGPAITGKAPHDETDAENSEATPFANDTTPILVLFEGDEGAHLTFEADSAVTPLPHPLAQKPIPVKVNAALAQHGVPENATTFDTAEILARIHPLLRHRVF
jgi:hypothetical protein